MRKDVFPGGACDRKISFYLLLATCDYVCELKQISVVPGYLCPIYKIRGLSMAFLPRHYPSTFDDAFTSSEAQRECSQE